MVFITHITSKEHMNTRQMIMQMHMHLNLKTYE